MASTRIAVAARLALREAKITTPRAPFHGAQSRTPRTPTASYASFRSFHATRSANKAGQPENARESSANDAAADSATETATRDSKSSNDTLREEASSSGNDWELNPNFDIKDFKDLPHSNFGVNQHIVINAEFKEVLRQVLWQFRAPIRYAFAYGSGVFPQSKSSGRIPTEAEIRAIHPKAPGAVQRAQDGTPKMIDFIFGVTFTQHWHSLNLNQHRDHYSMLGSLGSGAVSYVQDRLGAGVYFNPYVVINGILVKYGVVNLDMLEKDLRDWDTLYLAGRLQKPVKILRDDARIRLANQMNLLSALRTALLLLPPNFTEAELYSTIAGISYMGDPRMSLPTENPKKVANIVGNNLPHFRRLYAPLVETLPNVGFNDPASRADGWMAVENDANLKLAQDMDPVKRGNMVRRLPKSFRERLYFQYQKKFEMPRAEFNAMMAASKDEDATQFRRREGGGFERRIAQDEPQELRKHVRQVIKQTVQWPSTTQSLKSGLTAGIPRTIRYVKEKMAKAKEGEARKAEEGETTATEKSGKDEKSE